MMRALNLLRAHGEQGSAHRVYRLGERWVRTEETPLGNVEYRKLPKEAQDILRSELGKIFPQVKEVLYFVPSRQDSMQQRGLIVKLPVPNERINVEVWEDGTFRIVSEDFHPEHHGIRGSVTPQDVNARDPDHERILREAYGNLQRHAMDLSREGNYNFEVRYGAVRRKREFSLRPVERGTRITVEYMSFGAPKGDMEQIMQNLAKIREKAFEAHERVGRRLMGKHRPA